MFTKLITHITSDDSGNELKFDVPSSYQLLHQYHKILAAYNIQGERACEFSFNVAQSQHFVVLMQ